MDCGGLCLKSRSLCICNIKYIMNECGIYFPFLLDLRLGLRPPFDLRLFLLDLRLGLPPNLASL